MTEPQAGICVLTGAGASRPLGLPTMDGLLPENFEQSLQVGERDVFDMIGNWALLRPDLSFDFEHLFTGVDYIANTTVNDPLAIAFAGPRGDRTGRFQFKSQSGTYFEANFDGYRRSAISLAETLKRIVHERLSRVDPSKAAKLYHAFFALLSELVGSRTQIDMFTTNYDRAVETSYEYEGESYVRFELIRGFKRSARARAPRFDAADYRRGSRNGLTVRLFKLHGSLDWRREGDTVVEVAADEYVGRNAVIYPLRKPLLEEPFKSLFELYEKRVAKAKICVVIGSSLRDDHIRRVLVDRVRESALHVVLVDPQAAQLWTRIEKEIGQEAAVRFVHTANVGFGGNGAENTELRQAITLAVTQARSSRA